ECLHLPIRNSGLGYYPRWPLASSHRAPLPWPSPSETNSTPCLARASVFLVRKFLADLAVPPLGGHVDLAADLEAVNSPHRYPCPPFPGPRHRPDGLVGTRRGQSRSCHTYVLSSLNNNFAPFRSALSKPSVNQA